MRSDKTNISSINFRIPMLNAACEADSFEAKSGGEPHMAPAYLQVQEPGHLP